MTEKVWLTHRLTLWSRGIADRVVASKLGLRFIMAALLLCSLVGFIFYLLDLNEATTIIVYALGTLVVSALTDRFSYWLGTAVAAILLFNCLFAEPAFTLLYYDAELTIAMIMLVVASMLLGMFCSMVRQKEREKAALDLEARSQQLRVDLLRAVGHDLRTPLTGISGDAQLLLSKDEQLSAEERRQLYASILRDAEWLNNMVENLLFVTRVDNGELTINKHPELLSELVDAALLHISGKQEEHQLEVTGDNELLLISVDANMIMQVIINLVNNAIQHTQAGSHITITTGGQDDWARLEVADDGPGLSGEAERVFQLFYSTAGVDKSERRGMGLGLSISRSIIEAHGGQLYFRPNQPVGAVFGFTLPRERMDNP